ncbi:MAG TPA: Hpt domain-containing protein [Mycobacteriales bacterium]|nr:Hpt domain-containing protein [Mycobacteriales bacterium]
MSDAGPRRDLPHVDTAPLRELFAGEVESRLPQMTAARAALVADGDIEAARELRRHAHTLASSAAVLGEDLAADEARRCEADLQPYVDGDADRVPADAARSAAAALDTLVVLLAPWLLEGGDRGH